MRYSQPFFDVDAYRAGKHSSSGPCQVCGGTAVDKYCETGGNCEPGSLEVWVPLCFEHRAAPLRNWRVATDEYLHTLIDFESLSSRSGETKCSP